MMKRLYIKQKVFSWRDKFTVWDEFGGDRYYVEGEIFTFGKKLHVYGADGGEAAFISEKVWSFLPRYRVYIDGEQVAMIVKEFTFLRPRYTIEGLGWEVQGSFWEHDYEISGGGGTVARIHKQWMTWGDCYEIDIDEGEDEVLVLAVVLAIDCVMAAQAAAAST